MARSAPEQPNVSESLRALGLSLLGHARTRVTLAGLELAQERQRLMAALVAAAVTYLFAALTLAGLGIALGAQFWGTNYRWVVVSLVLIAFALATAISGVLTARRLARPSTLFRASLAELSKDEVLVRSGLHPEAGS